MVGARKLGIVMADGTEPIAGAASSRRGDRGHGLRHNERSPAVQPPSSDARPPRLAMGPHRSHWGQLPMSTTMTSYYTLGCSGLRVSRLALGTMTFGTEWGFGADKDTARALFNAYVEAGGNFFDTADMYTGGTAEMWLGEFIAERGMRDKAVIAT